MRPILHSMLAAATLALAVPAVAQTYPNKPVRIIAGLTPGGPGDIVVRGVAHKGLIHDAAARAQFLDKAGLVVQSPTGESAEAFARLLASERDKYAALVKTAGVKIE